MSYVIHSHLDGFVTELKRMCWYSSTQKPAAPRYEEVKHRLDLKTVDKYSQASVDAYNQIVHEANGARDDFNAQVAVHRSCVDRFNAAVSASNQAVQLYNATNFSRKVMGGVDLEVRKKLEVEPVKMAEEQILRHFRPVAEEIYETEASKLLTQVPERSSVVQDVQKQKRIHLNVWPLVARPSLKPTKLIKGQGVLLHSLQPAEPYLHS